MRLGERVSQDLASSERLPKMSSDGEAMPARYNGEVESDAIGIRLHKNFPFFTEHNLFIQVV
jgi:hypothetical protein